MWYNGVMDIQTRVTNAIAGRRPTYRFAVAGVNSRGESFRIDRYVERWEAEDYAEEVRSYGGTAKVEKL